MLCCAVCQRGMYFTVDFPRVETSVCKVIFFFLILEGQSNKYFFFSLEIEISLLFWMERSVQDGFLCLIDCQAEPWLFTVKR